MDKVTDFYIPACDRALGLIDLNPLSSTYGCADRSYWHYQDSKAFDVGSCLNAMIGFLGAREAFPHREHCFGEAVNACLHWWTGRILDHQSIDEYFPYQESFCALAHTTLAVCITAIQMKRTGKHLDSKLIKAIGSALNLLCSNCNRPLSANQSFAAMIAQDMILCDLPEVEKPSLKILFEPVFDAEEQCYVEYSGFDLGYTLLCIDLLVLASCFTHNGNLQEKYSIHLNRLLATLKLFISDYTFLPELGSRGNAHKLLGGLSYLSSKGHKDANVLLQELSNEKRFPMLVDAHRSDDKYLAFFHLTSLLLEHHAHTRLPTLLPAEFLLQSPSLSKSPVTKYCRTKNFILYRNQGIRAVISLLQGGCIAVDLDGTIDRYGQFLVRFKSGKTYFSSSVTPQLTESREGEIHRVKFPLYGDRYASSTAVIQNPIFSALLRIGFAIPYLRDILRNAIYKKKMLPKEPEVIGTRTIKLGTEVTIEDQLSDSIDLYYKVYAWSKTDGHATRLFSNSEKIFEDISSQVKLSNKIAWKQSS